MLNKVRKAITENKLIPQGARILAAVSGGVDSIVMLDILHRLSAEMNFSLAVGHVNHNMRGEEARLDAESVHAAAERMGLEFRLGEIPAEEWRTGGNKQERARELRFGLLRGMARDLSADFIATAHNADDQAETFIDRLLRGSGPHGLSGIARCNGELLRPLLDCTRAEIVEYATIRGLSWREDRSNADRKYRRSYIRHEIMPLLRQLNPQTTEAVCNAMQTIRSQSEAVDLWAEREYASRHRRDVRYGVILEIRGLEFLPEAVQVAVFQKYLAGFFPDLRAVGRAQLMAMQKMLSGNSPKAGVRLPGALLLMRSGAEFRIVEKDPPAPSEIEIAVSNEGIYVLPGGTLELRVLSSRPDNDKDAQSVLFDLDKLSGGLKLRSRRYGDTMLLPNLGRCKVSKIISGRYLPAGEGLNAVILEDDENILWIIGVRRSAHAYVNDSTKKFLHATYRPGGSDNG